MTSETAQFFCELSIAEHIDIVPALPLGDLEKLCPFAEQVMMQLQLSSPMSLSIHITDDEHVRQLNLNYRSVDSATDILSFGAESLPAEIQEMPHLGDLIFSYEYTLRQALREGHEPLDEFCMLIIHGILHLVGYTHDNPESQREMWQKQTELLNLFNINIIVPDYVHSMDDIERQ